MISAPLNIVFFPHAVNHGLAGTNRLQNIIYFLKEEGVYSLSNIALSERYDSSDQLTGEPFLKDYKEIYYGPSVFAFIKHIFQTIGYLKKFRKSGSKNVIYFYGEVDIKNFFFLKWARLIGYKIVIDVVEDLETVTNFKSFKNKLKYKSGVFFRKRLSGYAHGFTVVSTHLKDKLHLAYPKIPLFFLPVTINKYLLSNEKISESHNIFTLFYSGSFNEKDGLPYLLSALKLLTAEQKSFKLLLSGKGTDLEMKKFWADVKKLSLDDYIDYRGFLSRTEYVKLLSQDADVLCMTRINSAYANAGFPFKLGEFLGTGKPVIASTVSDIKKYLNENEAYLVPPEDALRIKEALIDIIANDEKAKFIGANGKKAAMKYFDHEIYSEGLKEFISCVK